MFDFKGRLLSFTGQKETRGGHDLAQRKRQDSTLAPSLSRSLNVITKGDKSVELAKTYSTPACVCACVIDVSASASVSVRVSVSVKVTLWLMLFGGIPAKVHVSCAASSSHSW